MPKTYVFRRPPASQRVNQLWRAGMRAGTVGRFPTAAVAGSRLAAWLHCKRPAPVEQRIARLTRHRYVAGQVQAGGRSESVAALDAASAVAARPAITGEASSASDIRSANAALVALIDDGAPVGEQTGAGATLAVGVGDIGSAIETGQAAAAVPGAVGELTTAADDLSAALVALRAALETGVVTEAGAGNVVVPSSSDDAVDAADASERFASMTAGCDELAATGDSGTATADAIGLGADFGVATDEASATSTAFPQAAESLAAAEALASTAGLIGNIAESGAGLILADASSDGQVRCEEATTVEESTDAGRMFAESPAVAEEADAADSIASSQVYFGDDPQEHAGAVETGDADWIAGGLLAESEGVSTTALAQVSGVAQSSEAAMPGDDSNAVASLVALVAGVEAAIGIADATLVRGSSVAEWVGAAESPTVEMAGSGSLVEQAEPADASESTIIRAAACAEGSAAAESAMGSRTCSAGGQEDIPATDQGAALGVLVAAALELASAVAAAAGSAAQVTACLEATSVGDSATGGVLAVVSLGDGAGAVDHVDRGGSIGDRVVERVVFADVIEATAAFTMDETCQPLDASTADVPFDPTIHAYNTATIIFDRRRAWVEYSSPHARHD